MWLQGLSPDERVWSNAMILLLRVHRALPKGSVLRYSDRIRLAAFARDSSKTCKPLPFGEGTRLAQHFLDLYSDTRDHLRARALMDILHATVPEHGEQVR